MKQADVQSWGIAVLRIVVGVVFLAHGAQKLFVYGFPGVAAGFGQMGIPFPYPSAVLVTVVEFFGGLALIAGLFTRLAAVPLAITMLVALFTAHLSGGFFLPKGFEYVLVLLAANVALVLTGSGAFALDNALAARSSSRTRVLNYARSA